MPIEDVGHIKSHDLSDKTEGAFAKMQFIEVSDEGSFSSDAWAQENVSGSTGMRVEFPGSWEAPRELPLTTAEVDSVKAAYKRDRKIFVEGATEERYLELMKRAAKAVAQSGLSADEAVEA